MRHRAAASQVHTKGCMRQLVTLVDDTVPLGILQCQDTALSLHLVRVAAIVNNERFLLVQSVIVNSDEDIRRTVCCSSAQVHLSFRRYQFSIQE